MTYIRRCIAAFLIALLLPVVFLAFVIICTTAIVKTLIDGPLPNDPEYWE